MAKDSKTGMLAAGGSPGVARTLDRWLCRAATAASLDEVLDESS